MATRILVIEDEGQIAELISFILESEGYQVEVLGNGVDAVDALLSGKYDLAVLDIMIPRLNGLEVCSRVRRSSSVPILMLTARTNQDEVLLGLEAGADDYLGKPFNPRELVLRVAAILRRRNEGLSKTVKIDDLTLSFARHEAELNGEHILLSALEWRILTALAEASGGAVNWEQLLEDAWSVDEWSGGREMVKAAIYRLRLRLKDDATSPNYIQTVRGSGYRLNTVDAVR